jgi:hypothetical protein
MRIRQFPVVAIVIAWAVACDAPTAPPESSQTLPVAAPSQAVAGQQSAERTPFQQSIMQAIAERRAQGLPVPVSVVYQYQEGPAAGAPRAAAPQGAPAAGQPVTVTARTIIQFANPEQAGLAQWPNLVVEGEVPPGAQGFVREGDYTQYVKDQIAQRYPDANTEFETGPRTYTFAESLTVATSDPASPSMAVRMQNLAALTTSDQLLMGFTVLGPNVDYHVEWSADFCLIWFFGCQVEVELVSFWAGFQMDWTIATRLPMALSVESPDPVLEGSVFSPATAATGVDWGPDDFSAVGVSPEDGNEFVLAFIFKLGLFVEVFDQSVVSLGVDVDLDEASSFATPLGVGQMFDLPSINVPVWAPDYGVARAEVGVALTPQAGSNRYLANWQGFEQGTGNGAITYTTSGELLGLGSMTALDGPGNAGIRLTDFRYYFNQFGMGLGVYFGIWVMGYGGTWTIPITQFALNTGAFGPYVETHAGTTNTLELLVPIQNVAPTVVLSRSGAMDIHGRQAFLARPGQVLTFTGDATDPGRDDLTLAWSWADGSPDQSTVYTEPYAVTETQTHEFGGACVYQVTLTATDDDLDAGQDQVAVIVSGPSSATARLEGYWQHQLGRMGSTDFDDAALECYLRVVEYMSAVFGELRDVSSLASAHNVIFMQENGGDPLEQLDRELLVVWLNFAHGAIGYDALVDTDGDGLSDTPFGDALAAVEALRADPAATAQAIRTVTRILHGVSVVAGNRTGPPALPSRK